MNLQGGGAKCSVIVLGVVDDLEFRLRKINANRPDQIPTMLSEATFSVAFLES